MWSSDIEDWKTLGGGLESTVVDLARFGDKLARNEIISPTSQTTMWTPPDTTNPYAYGWEMDSTIPGRLIATKTGRQNPGALSYLEIHPDQNITIAVLMNSTRMLDTNRARTLGVCIRNIILSPTTSTATC
ncbi:serine hydrolase [Thermomonospora umbrina]|uniref:serine hydrolase n=1 Tax=Thermomonospora umbrina TaxID=111806 RepID=UPI000E2281FF|nr:serine hydrolase [Thermomonospora umbrina]